MKAVTVRQRNAGWVNNLLVQQKNITGKQIAVGYPRGKAQPYGDGESVASVAARQVFGIGVIQRDFMTYAQPFIAEATSELMKSIARLTSLPGNHASEIKGLMESAGLAAANAIKSAIIDGTWPDNSSQPMSKGLRAAVAAGWNVAIPVGMSYKAAKLKFRKSDKPLIDTAHMKNSTTYVVRDKV